MDWTSRITLGMIDREQHADVRLACAAIDASASQNPSRNWDRCVAREFTIRARTVEEVRAEEGMRLRVMAVDCVCVSIAAARIQPYYRCRLLVHADSCIIRPAPYR